MPLHILMTSYWNKAQVHFTLCLFTCNANINGGVNERAKQPSKTTSVMAHCVAVIITLQLVQNYRTTNIQ